MGVDLGGLATRREISFEALSGRSIAIDAHNTIYQFLSIIRQKDGTPLMDAKGRITSHLSGLFYRNARLIAAGVKPVFVFDGPPPHLKRVTIEERREAKEEAERRFHAARERGDFAAA
ncbi:MAG: flap structure-specific endonuclease, partial [Candidatus Micrarchaeia archaeon]